MTVVTFRATAGSFNLWEVSGEIPFDTKRLILWLLAYPHDGPPVDNDAYPLS